MVTPHCKLCDGSHWQHQPHNGPDAWRVTGPQGVTPEKRSLTGGEEAVMVSGLRRSVETGMAGSGGLNAPGEKGKTIPGGKAFGINASGGSGIRPGPTSGGIARSAGMPYTLGDRFVLEERVAALERRVTALEARGEGRRAYMREYMRKRRERPDE